MSPLQLGAIFASVNMSITQPQDVDSISSMFRAFSDPTRLRILRMLHGRELCVGDIVAVLQVPQPTASRHLAALRSAGLVVSREEGPWRFYELAAPRLGFHRKLLDCLTTCFCEVPEFEEDQQRLALRESSGGCC